MSNMFHIGGQSDHKRSQIDVNAFEWVKTILHQSVRDPVISTDEDEVVISRTGLFNEEGCMSVRMKNEWIDNANRDC